MTEFQVTVYISIPKMNQSLSLIKVQISQEVRACICKVNDPVNLALFPLYLEAVMGKEYSLETNGPG